MDSKGRRALGYKGPVSRVVVERDNPNAPNGLYVREWLFDREGKLIETAPLDVQVLESDGKRVEIRSVSGLTGWSPEGLNEVGLATGGAAFAETIFTSEGVPSETIFRGYHGEEILRTRYVCDERGRVLDAYQYSGETPPLSAWGSALGPVATANRDAYRQVIKPGVELFRVTFRYDDEGRVVEQSSYVVGKLTQRIAHTYNGNGDRATAKTDEEEPVRFEYEYDQWGNWTRQVVYHPMAVTESRRLITYYE